MDHKESMMDRILAAKIVAIKQGLNPTFIELGVEEYDALKGELDETGAYIHLPQPATWQKVHGLEIIRFSIINHFKVRSIEVPIGHWLFTQPVDLDAIPIFPNGSVHMGQRFGFKHNEHLKIYIASDFSNRNSAKQLAKLLTAKGHIVVSAWHSLGPMGDDNGVIGADKQKWAFTDLVEIDNSDCLIRIGGGERGRGGQFVELGYAIGRQVPCFILNHNEVQNIFEYVQGVVICTGLQDLFEKLTDGRNMNHMAPYPEAVADLKEMEIMKLQALCLKFGFAEDATSIKFYDGDGKQVYAGSPGSSRNSQIDAAYSILLQDRDPIEVLKECGVEAQVKEEAIGDINAPSIAQEEVISSKGAVTAGQAFKKTANDNLDSTVVKDEEGFQG